MNNLTKYKDLTVVIVAFHSDNIIYDCIKAIDKDIKVIIVDNSNSLTLKRDIEEKYSNIEVILSKTNLGYGKANNLGINHSDSNFILILNPDTLVENDSIKILLDYAKDYRPAIVAPIVKSKKINEFNFGYFHDSSNKNFNLNNVEAFEVDFVRGFALLINKQKFKNRFFDENYFTYMEELDLCLRIKKLGEKIFIHPKSRVSHIGASSHNQNIQFEMELSRNWHWMWSNYYYYKKNFNVFTAIKKTYLRLISSFLKMSFYIFVNKKKYLIYRQRFTGLISAYLNKPSWYRPKVDFD